MAHEALTSSSLIAALKNLVADISDLVGKEIRLARAEIGEKIGSVLQAGLWMAVAAVAVVIAGFLVMQAIVFGIASFGVALHWSCLIVAAVLGVVAAASAAYGRAKSRISLVPTRTLDQIDKDITAMRSN